MGQGSGVTRQIDPEAGHALEILGHAIEYLIDSATDRIIKGASIDDELGTLAAADILKALNREIYFACPPRLSLRSRFLNWLRYVLLRRPVRGAHKHVQGKNTFPIGIK